MLDGVQAGTAVPTRGRRSGNGPTDVAQSAEAQHPYGTGQKQDDATYRDAKMNSFFGFRHTVRPESEFRNLADGRRAVSRTSELALTCKGRPPRAYQSVGR